MPKRSSKPSGPNKLPADVNQRGKAIVDFLTRDRDAEAEPAPATVEPEAVPDPIKEAARALGKRGGLKGGKARAESLSPAKRSEIAKKAAEKRWGKRTK